MRAFAIEKIKAKIFCADHIPITSWGEQIEWVHFIMKACFIALNFFQVINYPQKPIHIVFLLILYGMNFIFELWLFLLKIFIIIILLKMIFLTIFRPAFNSQRRSSRSPSHFVFLSYFLLWVSWRRILVLLSFLFILKILPFWWYERAFIHK